MDTISQSEISVQDATNEVGAFLLKYAPSAASGIGNFLNLTRGYHTAQLFCHLKQRNNSCSECNRIMEISLYDH